MKREHIRELSPADLDRVVAGVYICNGWEPVRSASGGYSDWYRRCCYYRRDDTAARAPATSALGGNAPPGG